MHTWLKIVQAAAPAAGVADKDKTAVTVSAARHMQAAATESVGVQVHMQDTDVLVLFLAVADLMAAHVAALAVMADVDQLVLLSPRLTHKG